MDIKKIRIRGEEYCCAYGDERHVLVKMNAAFGQNQPGDICGLTPETVRNMRPETAVEPVPEADVRKMFAALDDAARKSQPQTQARK